MKEYKVYGGYIFVNSKQVRGIVATKTKKRAAELFNVPYYYFKDYFSETGNEIELLTALNKVETVFYVKNHYDKDYHEVLW